METSLSKPNKHLVVGSTVFWVMDDENPVMGDGILEIQTTLKYLTTSATHERPYEEHMRKFKRLK